MSIRLRIQFLFAAALILVAAAGAWTTHSLRRTAAALAESNLRHERSTRAQRVETQLLWSTHALREYLAGDDSGTTLERALRINRKVEAELETLTRSAASASDREATTTLREAFGGYLRTIERAGFLNEKDQRERARRLVGWYLDRELLPSVQTQVERFVESHRTQAEEAEARMSDAVRSVIVLSVGSGLLWIVLGVGLYFALRTWLVRPVERLSRAARRVASGELDAMDSIRESGELETLARELSTMGERLARAQEKLLEQERLAAMGELTFSVAHNVRNPLASVRALAQTSLRNPDEIDLKRENDQTIIDTVDRLDRWLKDLLQSLRPIRLSRTVENIGAVVAEVSESLSSYAQQRGVSIALRQPVSPIEAEVDRRHLEQALIAVLANGIEASPRGGELRVRVALDDATAQVSIIVEDDGPGIPADQHTKIFTPYYTTKKSGTGLGLSLARRIALGHGGRLDLRDDSTRGARFEFRLPLAHETDPKSASAASSTRRSQPTPPAAVRGGSSNE